MHSELYSALVVSPAFYGYEEIVRRELRSFGMDVTCLTYPSTEQQLHRRLYYFLLKHTRYTDLETDRQRLKLRQLRDTIDAFNNTVLETVHTQAPDLVLVLKGDYLRPETVTAIGESTEAITVLWTYDKIGSLPYTQASLPHYDHVYSYDPADSNRHEADASVKHLPLAHDDSVYKARDELTGPPIDISFVGSLLDNRRREVLSKLVARMDADIHIWSRAWNWHNPISLYRYKIRHRSLGKSIHNTHVDHTTINEIYNRSKICLNIHKSWKVDGDQLAGLNMRTFEIAGAGGFQLTNDPGNVHTTFEIGEEIAIYEDIDDLIEKVRYYLENPERREQIAARGSVRANDEHTFSHRINTIVNDISESTR